MLRTRSSSFFSERYGMDAERGTDEQRNPSRSSGFFSERHGMAPLILLCLFVAALLCCFAPSRAFADTVTRVDDLFGSVGGNVYITQNPTGENAQFWAGGAWHDFSEVDPPDKSHDGVARALGDGWFIQWQANNYGGEYMFWRYHSGWNYNGVTWNNCFKVRFNNVGYTAAGENIDSIVAFDRVMVWKWNETPAPTWFAPFEVTKDYGPLVGATTYSQNTGVDLQFTSLFVKNGTDTLIDANSEIDIMYWDIDQPVVNPDGSFDYSSAWREGVKKVSGYKDEALIGTNSELAVSDSNTWFRSTRSDPSNVPTSKSTVVMKASPIYVTGFRAYGNGVSTGIGYDSKVKIYPEWQDPVKSPTVQIKNRGEVATFDVVEDFPYVADTNKAASIVMSDELDPALDASQATVKVYKGAQDVTDNWTISRSGRTVTATAKNTGHGYVEGEHTFKIAAPVSATADLSSYERDGDYWKVPNRASVAVNNVSKNTNIVYVNVPYASSGSWTPKTLTKTLQLETLTDGMFTWQLLDVDNGDAVLQEVRNLADGTVQFAPVDYSTGDAGKTYHYRIVEKPEGTAFAFDQKTINVSVEVKDEGNGTITAQPTYDTADFSFVNALKKTTMVNVTLHKSFTGPDAHLLDGMFSFEVKNSMGQVVKTVTNDADGNVVIPFDITQDDLGRTLEYTVSEVNDKRPFVEYDDKKVTIQLSVSENASHELIVSENVIGGGVFANKYRPLILPNTGNLGTKGFLNVAGFALVFLGAYLLVSRRRTGDA